MPRRDSYLFCKNLTAARKLCKYEVFELAYAIDVPEQTVIKWESGEEIPDLMTVCRISEKLGISVDFLLKGKSVDGFSRKERAIIRAYRAADTETKSAVDDVLEIPHEAISGDKSNS